MIEKAVETMTVSKVNEAAEIPEELIAPEVDTKIVYRTVHRKCATEIVELYYTSKNPGQYIKKHFSVDGARQIREDHIVKMPVNRDKETFTHVIPYFEYIVEHCGYANGRH